MKINKAYKFRLEPNAEQGVMLTRLVDSARFVWNQILAASFEMFAKGEFINATNLVNKITGLKDNPDSRWASRQITALESILRLLTIFEIQTLVLFAISPPAGEFGAY